MKYKDSILNTALVAGFVVVVSGFGYLFADLAERTEVNQSDVGWQSVETLDSQSKGFSWEEIHTIHDNLYVTSSVGSSGEEPCSCPYCCGEVN